MKYRATIKFVGRASILRIRVLPVEFHRLLQTVTGFRVAQYGLPRRARR